MVTGASHPSGSKSRAVSDSRLLLVNATTVRGGTEKANSSLVGYQRNPSVEWFSCSHDRESGEVVLWRNVAKKLLAVGGPLSEREPARHAEVAELDLESDSVVFVMRSGYDIVDVAVVS